MGDDKSRKKNKKRGKRDKPKMTEEKRQENQAAHMAEPGVAAAAAQQLMDAAVNAQRLTAAGILYDIHCFSFTKYFTKCVHMTGICDVLVR